MKNYKIEMSHRKITNNDVLFVCFMIEKVARQLHQKNKYVVNALGREGLERSLRFADILHCENPDKIANGWIKDNHMRPGNFFVERVRKELVDQIPTEMEMGHVYQRLILGTKEADEDYPKAMIRIYNAPLTDIIDNYNTAAYYTPSYLLQQAYYANSFNAIH